MPSRKGVHLLAVAAIAALLPLVGASNAHASTNVGNYQLLNRWTTLCADLPGTGANPIRTVVWQDTCYASGDNQAWGMENTRNVNGRQLFVLVNVKSGLCMDLPGTSAAAAGTEVSINGCAANSSTDNQEWYVKDVTGSGGDEIINNSDGLCLDVSGWASDKSDKADRQPLTVYTCSSAPGGNWGGWVYSNVSYDDHLWKLNPVAG